MKILVADDHKFIVDDLLDELSELLPDAKCTGTCDPSEVMPLFHQNLFDVVFIDVEMPGANGMQLAEQIQKIKPRTNIIYITGYGKYALESYKTYASAFLEKPLNTEMIKDALDHLRYPVSNVTDEALESMYSGTAVIGKKIERAREEHGMTRNEFAASMGVTLQTVYRWESGERTPDVLTLMNIAKILGVPTDRLLP
jgi:two-component SAPR family response regulator